jgi:integrase
MKKGKHPEKALSAIQVRQIKEAGRYTDGNGLYLVVDASGAKRWLLRVVVRGKRRDIGLGGLSYVSLAEAREKAATYRKIARDGGDPIEQLRMDTKEVLTFAKAAEQVHLQHKASWSNGKHQQQWINTIEQYAYPIIGETAVDQVTTPDILKILGPIWLTKPETARRVRQRIGTVLAWAKAAGHRTGDNPVEGVSKGLPKQGAKEKHHAALPYTAVPGFITALHATGSDERAKLAFEFLILTAARTSEALKANWTEFDLSAKLWTVPAERMKAKRVHRVPLSGRCIEILKQAKLLSGDSEFAFPGRTQKAPLSNMTLLTIIRRMRLDATTHGFRSSFRDWAAETTSFPRELAEMALAHTIENKVEAAYRRGDLLEKRAEMMESWAKYLGVPDDAEEHDKLG